MKVTLVLPVLNTEERLVEVLGEIERELASVDYETVIVYDVTKPELLPDIQAEQAELQRRFAVIPHTRVNQRGFGSALLTGMSAGSGDVAIPIMADCSDDIAAIPRMIEKIEAGADVVVGSRYMAGGAIVGDTPKQKLSRFYSWLMRFLTGIPAHDVSNSFKAYRRPVWESVNSEAKSFDFSVEMVVKAAVLGFKLAEVPSVWTNRLAGTSHFSMVSELSNYGRWLVYAIRNLPSPSPAASVVRPLITGCWSLFQGGLKLRQSRQMSAQRSTSTK